MKPLIFLLLLAIFVHCDKAKSDDPSWLEMLRRGSDMMRLDMGREIYFRNIAKSCKTAIKQTEEFIDKSYPQKLYVPKEVLIVYESPKYGDCGITISVHKDKLNQAKNLPTEIKSFVSDVEEIKLLYKKQLQKGLHVSFISKVGHFPIKKDAEGKIDIAMGLEICYNKFNSNAAISTLKTHLIFCLSSFDYYNSMLLGIYDEENREWLLE